MSTGSTNGMSLGRDYVFNRPMTDGGSVWGDRFENSHKFCYVIC